MDNSTTPQDAGAMPPASDGYVAQKKGAWRRCCDELPQTGVYVVAVWVVFGQTTAHVARRGVPAWYVKSGTEMICPTFWMPLPADK